MRKSEKNHRRALWLARFWNYGFFVLYSAVLGILDKAAEYHEFFWIVSACFMPCALAFYGVCYIIVAKRWHRSFVYSIQLSRQKHNPYIRMFWPPDRKMQREGYIIGSFFLVLGILLFIAILLEI